MNGIAYRPEIDGLRAIAVVGVVLYHAGLGIVNQGFVGVDVFFVISGYLITALLQREWQSTGRIDVLAFYARRVRRILPAMLAVVVVTLALSAWLLSPLREQRHVAQAAAASLLMAGNFFFQKHSGGYFDADTDEMPLLHLWSLSVEEQFYLVWPVLLIALLRYRPRWLVPVLAGLALLSFGLAEWLIARWPSAAFFQMPARFWELALGGLVALRAPARIGQGPAMAAAYAGVTTLLVALLLDISPGHFPGWGAAPAVLGSVLLLVAIHGARDLGLVGAWLGSGPMRFLGLISYSLYLWHWPLLAIDKATRAGPQPMVVALSLCALAVVLAWLSYRFVETPFRRARPPELRAVAAGLAVSVVLSASAGVFAHHSDAGDNLDALAVQALRDMPANMARCHFGEDDPVDVFPRPGCNSADGEPEVVIWGDSYALAWQPFAFAVAAHDGVAATSFSRDSCAPALASARRNERQRLCHQFNQKVIARLKSRRVATLIISARWLAPMHAGIADVVADLKPHVGRILVIGPTPTLLESAPLCIQSGKIARCARQRSEFEASAQPARTLLASLNVETIDPSGYFCNAVECPVLKDGRSLYWDDDHVASSHVRGFAQAYLLASGNPPLPGPARN